MKKINIVLTILLLITGFAIASDLDLQFSSEIVTGNAELVLPDRLVIQTTQQPDPNNLMHTNLLQPPGPPDHDYTRITLDNNDIETRQQMVHDPNTMLLLTMQLSAYDADQSGITGKGVLTLDNPEALDLLGDDMLVYLRRFDADGTYLGNYDLYDSENHTIEWQVTDQNGQYATIELIAEKKIIAADLDDSDAIDLNDFAVMAQSWQTQLPLDGIDIYKDTVMDFTDMLVMAQVWLNRSN